MKKRECLRCNKVYEDARSSPFRTCPQCRVAVTDDGGGCHFWANADADPRVNKHREARTIDQLMT